MFLMHWILYACSAICVGRKLERKSLNLDPQHLNRKYNNIDLHDVLQPSDKLIELIEDIIENGIRKTRLSADADARTRSSEKSSVEKEEDVSRTVPEKRGQLVHEPCKPRPVVVSTYTKEKGIQTPKSVSVQRCLGGMKNPENHQCQPSKVEVKCVATRHENGQADMVGIRSHLGCEERCICARKECKGKNTHPLICPKGFVANSRSCMCHSIEGDSIFYRNMGIIEDWDRDLHLLCRDHQQTHGVKLGDSFSIEVEL